MNFLQYRITPSELHPRWEELGEGLVTCWIDAASLSEADRVARTSIEEEAWQILEREECSATTEDDYEDDEEGLQYYQQALSDKEVFVYHLSPKQPVYWVIANVTQSDSTDEAEAHFFLVGDTIAGDDDVFAHDFWNEDRARLACESAQKAVEEEGFRVASVLAQRPCARSDVPEDLVDAYDEAEESDSCLVLFVDDDGE